jgi:hypothetical protein
MRQKEEEEEEEQIVDHWKQASGYLGEPSPCHNPLISSPTNE